MYKRFQVLLTDWQAEYAKFIAERYDLSFSEAIRAVFSVGSLRLISAVQPEYTAQISKKHLSDITKKAIDPSRDAEKHRFLSKLYFETRKAIEHRLTQVKKQEKSKP